MYKMKMTSNTGDTIEVPFIACEWTPNFPNSISVGEQYPFTILEDVSDINWIPEIPIEQLTLGTPRNVDYQNQYNNFRLQLRYNRQKSRRYDTEFVVVEPRLYNGNSYMGGLYNWAYPYDHFGASYFYSILTYDSKNKVAGAISGGDREIFDILYPAGRDYATLNDTEYFKVKQNKVYVKKGTYQSNSNYYFNGSLRPPGTTHIIAEQSYISTTNGITMETVTDGSGNARAITLNGWNAIFTNVTLPSYPNQNPDNDQTNGQDTPDTPLPGDGDTSSDPIPNPPAKPTFDVTNTGFVVIYNPSVIDIRNLAYFMWSGDFTDLIKKMFASPFEAIISLKMLFCPVTVGASQTVWLGNVETDVSMPKVSDQFTDIDLGTLNVNEFFGSFADYAPFTKVQIYLPFIGYKDLNVDEVMNAQLHLRYRVDVYTGACIAYITVTKNIKSTQLNSILYQFDGNCAMEIPFTSNDNSRYVSAIMNAVASSAMSLANTSGFTVTQPPVGNFTDKADRSFHLGTLRPVAQGMLDIISSKPNVQRAGALSGAVSAMAVKQPYLIIHRPIAQMPADYQHYLGIPLNLTMKLSEVTGFTIVSQIFFTSPYATDEEIVMITELLKGGVIL